MTNWCICQTLSRGQYPQVHAPLTTMRLWLLGVRLRSCLASVSILTNPRPLDNFQIDRSTHPRWHRVWTRLAFVKGVSFSAMTFLPLRMYLDDYTWLTFKNSSRLHLDCINEGEQLLGLSDHWLCTWDVTGAFNISDQFNTFNKYNSWFHGLPSSAATSRQ